MTADPLPDIESEYFEYDPTTETYRAAFDATRGADSTVVAVVELIGTVTDREVTDIPPLYRTIDPSALGELVSSQRENPVDVTFTHESVRVRVSSRGTVVARPVDDETGAD